MTWARNFLEQLWTEIDTKVSGSQDSRQAVTTNGQHEGGHHDLRRHNWSACTNISSPTVTTQLASAAAETYALTAVWLTACLHRKSSSTALHAAESKAPQQNHTSANLVANSQAPLAAPQVLSHECQLVLCCCKQ